MVDFVLKCIQNNERGTKNVAAKDGKNPRNENQCCRKHTKRTTRSIGDLWWQHRFIVGRYRQKSDYNQKNGGIKMLELGLLVVFFVLFAFVMIFSIIGWSFAIKLKRQYSKLLNKYIETQSENIKLQHDVYRLTFITPSVDENDKKGEKGNGRK